MTDEVDQISKIAQVYVGFVILGTVFLAGFFFITGILSLLPPTLSVIVAAGIVLAVLFAGAAREGRAREDERSKMPENPIDEPKGLEDSVE